MSNLGRFIVDNLSESLSWTVWALSVKALERLAVVKFSEHSCRIDQAEQALIAHLRPALNKALTVNGYQTIPEKYKNRRHDDGAGAGAMRAARAAGGE